MPWGEVLIPESQVQPRQIVSASDYQMHVTSPAHLPPSRYLETQMPTCNLWRSQIIQRQIIVFSSGVLIWIEIQKSKYTQGTQSFNSWWASKYRSGMEFSNVINITVFKHWSMICGSPIDQREGLKLYEQASLIYKQSNWQKNIIKIEISGI